MKVKKRKDRGITRASLEACLCELTTARIIIEGTMEESILFDRIQDWRVEK